jgi:hypothetical protein
MILWVADNRNLTAILPNDLAFGNGFSGVIGALCVEIRANGLDQFLNRRFVKYRNKIDATKCGYYLGPLILVDIRAARAF